jgi:DNA polymerase-3 subunit chi
MTQVDFHFNAADKWHYVCRLLRKASAQGRKIGVWSSQESLQGLNQSLWQLTATDFVTHCLIDDDQACVQNSMVVLGADWSALRKIKHLDVYLNVNDVAPPEFNALNRLIEVVGPEEQDKLAARQRWKQYTQLGFAIHRYDLAAQAAVSEG